MGETNQAALILALTAENAELQRQLASAQDLLVDTASEAGQLHARIEMLHSELADARAARDAWRDEAERLVGWGVRTA